MLRDEANNDWETAKFEARRKTMKYVLLALFIVSLFSIYIALALVASKTTDIRPMPENMWMFYILLPIPLASLILGIIYKIKGFKTTKNIVVGIIFTPLLFLFGSFSFMFGEMYLHDFLYVDQIEEKIEFCLPDTGEIATLDMTDGTAPGAERDFSISDVVFTDNDERSAFNADVSTSGLWMTSVNTTLVGFFPSMYSYLPSTKQYDYYMIYNVDQGTYNTVPDSSGTYNFILIAYDSLTGGMKICEYSLEVVI